MNQVFLWQCVLPLIIGMMELGLLNWAVRCHHIGGVEQLVGPNVKRRFMQRFYTGAYLLLHVLFLWYGLVYYFELPAYWLTLEKRLILMPVFIFCPVLFANGIAEWRYPMDEKQPYRFGPAL